MPRTPVTPNSLAAAVAALINTQTVAGGQIKAVASGDTIKIYTQSDAPGASYNTTFELVAR